jgi:hypothetical protein
MKNLAERAALKRLSEDEEMPPPSAKIKSLASSSAAVFLGDAKVSYAASRVGAPSVAPSVASSTGSKIQRRNLKSRLQQQDARAKKILCGQTSTIYAGESTSRSAQPGVTILGTTEDNTNLVLCSTCRSRNAQTGCSQTAYPGGYDDRRRNDQVYRRQMFEKGWGPTQAEITVTPAQCVELLKLMGVIALIENIGVAEAASPSSDGSFVASPLYMQLVFMILGMLFGILIRDATRGIVPYFR